MGGRCELYPFHILSFYFLRSTLISIIAVILSVAVWANSVRSLGQDAVMKFRFLGTGASGVLGERWATMAVLSALRMWQQGEMAKR